MSSKIFLAVATCLPLVLAGCSNSSGGTTSGTTASSTAGPAGAPTPPVRVLGLDVIHIETTDAYSPSNYGFYQIQTSTGPISYDEARYELVCPGVPPRGNECTMSEAIVDGTRYALAGGTQDRSVGFYVTYALSDTQSWAAPRPKTGINFFEGAHAPADRTVLGGNGSHSLFIATSANVGGYGAFGSYRGPAQTISVAMGELHDGRPAYSGPNEPTGTATWRGAMVGIEMSSGTRLFGDSAIVYDFADNNVDVELSGISPNDVDQLSSGSYSGPSSFSWTDLRVNNDASFYIPGHGNDKAGTVLHPTLGYIDGDFYGPNAEETAGVFERQGVSGAWLAIRESDDE